MGSNFVEPKSANFVFLIYKPSYSVIASLSQSSKTLYVSKNNMTHVSKLKENFPKYTVSMFAWLSSK